MIQQEGTRQQTNRTAIPALNDGACAAKNSVKARSRHQRLSALKKCAVRVVKTNGLGPVPFGKVLAG